MKNMKNYKKGDSATRAKAKYNAKAYDIFQIVVPKGKKDEITDAAEKLGYKSRNEFVSEAIDEKINREAKGSP